jgi:hypothetical protein
MRKKFCVFWRLSTITTLLLKIYWKYFNTSTSGSLLGVCNAVVTDDLINDQSAGRRDKMRTTTAAAWCSNKNSPADRHATMVLKERRRDGGTGGAWLLHG